MKHIDWMQATYAMLRDSPLTRREIAAGSCVDYEWLSKFSQGRISDPGVRKVQRLHDFLLERSVPPRQEDAA
jgi:hypothetical protein